MSKASQTIRTEHEELLSEIKEYTDTTLAEMAREFDDTEKLPEEAMAYFFQKDIFSLLTTDSNADLNAFLEIIRIVSTKFAALASILLTQGFYAVKPLHTFGTQAQKNQYLPALLNGQIMGGFGLTEKYGGSDLSYIQTEAIETKDGWLLTGEKQFISNAPIAEVFLVVAKTTRLDKPDAEELGIFLVDRENEGVTVSEKLDKMGIKSLPVASAEFKIVNLSQASLLSGEMDGWKQVEEIMNYIKLSISMQALGIAQGSFDTGMQHMQLVRKFGNRLIDNQSTQQEMAKISASIHATHAFILQIIQENPNQTLETAIAKLLTADLAINATETIIQLTGGYGYMKDSDIERYVRDAKVTAIYGGSSDSQMKTIAQPWLNNENKE